VPLTDFYKKNMPSYGTQLFYTLLMQHLSLDTILAFRLDSHMTEKTFHWMMN